METGGGLAFSDVLGDLGNDDEGEGKEEAKLSRGGTEESDPHEGTSKGMEDKALGVGGGEAGTPTQPSVLRAKHYVRGSGPSTKLASPLDWMLDFDLDEDEILKSQSTKQCIEDNDAAGDLRRLARVKESEKGKKTRVFQSPVARPASTSSVPAAKSAQEETCELVQSAAARPGASKRKHERLEGTSSGAAEDARPVAVGEEDNQERKAEAGKEGGPEADPDATEEAHCSKKQMTERRRSPSPGATEEKGDGEEGAHVVGQDHRERVIEEDVEAEEIKTDGVAKGPGTIVAVLPAPVEEKISPTKQQHAAVGQEKSNPSNLLQSSKKRVEDIERLNAHIDAKSKHMAKLMEHAEKVKESATSLKSNSSKSHVTLITSGSKMFKAFSPLQACFTSFCTHACLLIQQRLNRLLDQAETSLQDFKTLSCLNNPQTTP
ncbi:hypothetical protein A3770_17p80640 [Chloropicon primus]|nr:hypothetical protein A3770_17p80640 [Chloropicon primus]|eukprot:QDZ25546.1 hypothetical protein A3770_17p80640 [Chloropicon primus]